MSLKEFLTSKEFFKQLVKSLAISLGLVFLALLMLQFYTRHGQALPVPELYGMTKDQYTSVLDDADLKFRVTDSTYTLEVPAGGVVDQIPDAGHLVKKNRTVYLTINAVSPEQVTIPRLTDISYRQALAQLESAGLIRGSVSYESSEFQNLVLKARIDGKEAREGEMVDKGTVVDLVVGKTGAAGQERLPDLTGMTLEEARKALYSTSLSLGVLLYDETVLSSADTLSAWVFRQHPSNAFTTFVTSGSEIDLWLTTDPSKAGREKSSEEDFIF